MTLVEKGCYDDDNYIPVINKRKSTTTAVKIELSTPAPDMKSVVRRPTPPPPPTTTSTVKSTVRRRSPSPQPPQKLFASQRRLHDRSPSPEVRGRRLRGHRERRSPSPRRNRSPVRTRERSRPLRQRDRSRGRSPTTRDRGVKKSKTSPPRRSRFRSSTPPTPKRLPKPESITTTLGFLEYYDEDWEKKNCEAVASGEMSPLEFLRLLVQYFRVGLVTIISNVIDGDHKGVRWAAQNITSSYTRLFWEHLLPKVTEEALEESRELASELREASPFPLGELEKANFPTFLGVNVPQTMFSEARLWKHLAMYSSAWVAPPPEFFQHSPGRILASGKAALTHTPYSTVTKATERPLLDEILRADLVFLLAMTMHGLLEGTAAGEKKEEGEVGEEEDDSDDGDDGDGGDTDSMDARPKTKKLVGMMVEDDPRDPMNSTAETRRLTALLCFNRWAALPDECEEDPSLQFSLPDELTALADELGELDAAEAEKRLTALLANSSFTPDDISTLLPRIMIILATAEGLGFLLSKVILPYLAVECPHRDRLLLPTLTFIRKLDAGNPLPEENLGGRQKMMRYLGSHATRLFTEMVVPSGLATVP